MCVSKEYVILKGVGAYYGEFPTDTTLEADANYKEYVGLNMKPERQFDGEDTNVLFDNGFTKSANKIKIAIVCRTDLFTYPKTEIDYENYFNDSDGNNLYDVLKQQFLYIQNNHTLGTRLHLVPSTEASRTTKNRNVSLVGKPTPISTEGGGGIFHNLELKLTYNSYE